jgi:hypothetical protein
VNKSENITTYHLFTVEERNSEGKAKSAAYKAIEIIMFKLAGLIGTVRAIRDVVQDLLKAFVVVDVQESTGGMVTRGQGGHYNDGLLWLRPSSQVTKHTIDIILTAGPKKDLLMEDDTGNEQPVINHQLSFHTAIRDRVCLAYIMQESLDALARGVSYCTTPPSPRQANKHYARKLKSTRKIKETRVYISSISL